MYNNLGVLQIKNKYKTSKYNFIFNADDGTCLAYNAFTGALAAINQKNEELFHKITTNPNIKLKSSNHLRFRENLLEGGFLVDYAVNEVELLKTRNWTGRCNNDLLQLFILPTLRCNFKCTYCFEIHRNETMSRKIEKCVFEFVKNKSKIIPRISVDWYGGEPLLAFGVIKRLNRQLDEICRKHKCNYKSSLTTNGYLLTPSVCKELRKLNFRYISVTLDGTSDIHDKRRRLRNGKGTFSRILENLCYATKYFPVYIRINFDKTNHHNVPELIDVLKKKGFDERNVQLRIRGVVSATTNPCEDTCFSTSEIAKTSIPFFEKALDSGFQLHMGMNYFTDYQFCPVDSVNQYMIGPKGYLFKCAEDFSPGERVGYINDNGEEIIDFPKWSMWIGGKDPFADSSCKNCKYLPICMGGCSMKRFIKGKDWCADERYNIINYLKLVYKFRKSSLGDSVT